MNRSDQNNRKASLHSMIEEREESLIEKMTNKVSDLIPKSLSGWLLKSRKRNLSARHDLEETFENDIHDGRSSAAAVTTAMSNTAAEPETTNSCHESAHRPAKRLKYSLSSAAADEIGNASGRSTHSNGGYSVAASRKTTSTQTLSRASGAAAAANSSVAASNNSLHCRSRFLEEPSDYQQPQHRSISNRSTNEVLGRAKSPTIFANQNGSSHGDRSYGSNMFSPIRSRSSSTSRNSSVMRSPYYSDNIGYGGASSYSENQRYIPDSEDNDSTATNTSSQFANRHRVKITFDTSISSPFSEKKVSGSNKSNLSNTAKKIFANLEKYERSLKWADSTGELLKARHIEQTNSAATAMASSAPTATATATTTSINNHPYTKPNQVEVSKKSNLKVPMISQFLQMKLKQQLQNSTENLRKIATSDSDRGTRTETSSPQPNVEQYQLPKALSNSTENTNAKFTLKIKNKITSRTRPPSTAAVAAAAAAASYDKQAAQPLNLPSVPLPITKMPHFDLTGAKSAAPAGSAMAPDRSATVSATQSPPIFQFSMPKPLGNGNGNGNISNSGGSELKSPSAVFAFNDFKFNSPKPITGDFGAGTAVMAAEGCASFSAATSGPKMSTSMSSVASAAASLQKRSSKFVCKQCLCSSVFSPADICDSCKIQSKSSIISTAAIASNNAGKTKTIICSVCGTEVKTASNASNKCFRCQMAETNLKNKLLNNPANNKTDDIEIQSPILAIPKNKDVNANKIMDKNFFTNVPSTSDKSGTGGAAASKPLASTSVYSLAPKPTKEELKIFEELQPKSSTNAMTPMFPLAPAKPTRSPAASADPPVPAFAPPAYSALTSSPPSGAMFSFGSTTTAPTTPTTLTTPITMSTATPTSSAASPAANNASPSSAALASAPTAFPASPAAPLKSTFSPPKFTFGTNSSTNDNPKPDSAPSSSSASLMSDKVSQFSFSLPKTTATITSATSTTAATMTTSAIAAVSMPSKGPPSYNATIAAAASVLPKTVTTTASFSFGTTAETKNTAGSGFSTTAFGMPATSSNTSPSQPTAFTFGKSDKSSDASAASAASDATSSATKTATTAPATAAGFGKPLTVSGEFSFAFPAASQAATTSASALTATKASTASTTSSVFGLGSPTTTTSTSMSASTVTGSSQPAAAPAATTFGFSFGSATSSPSTTAKTNAGASSQGGFGGFGSFSSSFSAPSSTTPTTTAPAVTPTTTAASSMFGSSVPSAFSGFGTGNKAAAAPASSPFSFSFQAGAGAPTSSSSSLKPPALSSPLSTVSSSIFGTNKGTTRSPATTEATSSAATASTSIPTFGALGSGSGLTSNGMFKFSGSASTASVFQNPASQTASNKSIFGSTPAATDNKFNFSFGGNASSSTNNPLSIGTDKTDSAIGVPNSSASIFGASAGVGSSTASAASGNSQQQQQPLFFGNSSASSAQPQQQQSMSADPQTPASQPSSLFTFGSSAAASPSVSAGFNFNMSPPQSFVFPSSQQQPATSSSFNNLPTNTMFNFNATPTSSQLNSTGNVSGLAGNATNPAIQQRRRLIAARRTKPRQ